MIKKSTQKDDGAKERNTSPTSNSQSLAPVIMVLGTSSSAGKSLLVTALCRIYARRGLRVAPFKAQNMSNNAGVCADGSEIGRAQITQAFAAGIAPTAAMNPILLKPESNMRSQVIVMGRAQETLPARKYFKRKQKFWSTVTGALDSLREEYDLVIAEGAGSPVELNLKSNDIVNMAIAKYAGADVLLVGDIDRGGIFAQLLGSLWLLPPDEQALIAGFVVNKFRGDPTLFEDGITILEEKGGKPVFGVLPWLKDLYLPEEDGVALDNLAPVETSSSNVDIAVIKLPHISNFDDFDPLLRESGVTVRFVQNAAELGNPDAVILPGTKSTIANLMWLHETGMSDKIIALAEQGKHVVGVCGGYQMLGTAVFDPNRIEGDQTAGKGLGLLPIETTFAGDKATHQIVGTISAKTGWLAELDGQALTGYEIHMGRTTTESAWVDIEKRGETAVSVRDGAISDNQKIWGCYIHGLFANENLRRAWLAQLGHVADSTASEADLIMASIDRLADSVEANLQLDKYLQIS